MKMNKRITRKMFNRYPNFTPILYNIFLIGYQKNLSISRYSLNRNNEFNVGKLLRDWKYRD